MGADGITTGDLKIDWRYQMIQLTDASYTHKPQGHGVMTFTGIVEPEEAEKMITGIQSYDTVRLVHRKEETVFFAGFIQDAHVKAVENIHYLKAEAVSYTKMLDIQLKERSFQNVKNSYRTVLDTVTGSYPNSYFATGEELGEPIGKMMMQYVETDWAFMKRLVSRRSLVLVPEITEAKPRFSVGVVSRKLVPIKEINYTLEKDVDSYRKALAKGADLIEYDFLVCRFSSLSHFQIGDMVEIEGQRFLICEIKAEIENALLWFRYKGKRKENIRQNLLYNTHLTGAAINGDIIAVGNNCIKLHLEIDKVQDEAGAKWFPYAAEASNIFYYMPEIGTKAKLYFQSADENDAIAIQSVRSAANIPEAPAPGVSAAAPAVKPESGNNGGSSAMTMSGGGLSGSGAGYGAVL